MFRIAHRSWNQCVCVCVGGGGGGSFFYDMQIILVNAQTESDLKISLPLIAGQYFYKKMYFCP